MRNTILPTLVIAMLPMAAFADWDVQKSEEDMFGNINVTVSALGDNGSLLRFECGSSTEPQLVYLITDNSGNIPEFKAQFFHMDAERNREASEALLTPWNENFVAVKVSDLAMLRSVAEHMAVAARPIPIGIEVSALELRLSDTFSPRGSTAAGTVILEHCVAVEPPSSVVDALTVEPEGELTAPQSAPDAPEDLRAEPKADPPPRD